MNHPNLKENIMCFLGMHEYDESKLECRENKIKGVFEYKNKCVRCGKPFYTEVPIHSIIPDFIRGD